MLNNIIYLKHDYQYGPKRGSRTPNLRRFDDNSVNLVLKLKRETNNTTCFFSYLDVLEEDVNS